MEGFFVIHCVGDIERKIGNFSELSEAVNFAKAEKGKYHDGVVVVLSVDEYCNRRIYEVF